MCDRLEVALKKTDSLTEKKSKLSTRSNFAKDDRIKPIKSPNPPVG
jgi:hypothetical protein